jgi:hypothetical protein
MANLKFKQMSFIKLMTESEELAQHGFQLLLRRDDFEAFFDPLKDAGLFDPKGNLPPVPVEEGYFQVPYWNALDYLTAVAKVAGERNDLPLAQKVMDVVRSVSRWREPDDSIRDNYHTSRKFAEILGLVPSAAVSVADLDFVPAWLSGRFEKGTVGRAFDEGALRRFLASQSSEDWDKALVILRHCTAIRWVDTKELGEGGRKPVTAVEDYWLKELINHHSREFGLRVGRKAAELFLERVRDVFSSGDRAAYSHSYRPAVEDHGQNHSWRGPENRSVEGLRDVILTWCDQDPTGAMLFVKMTLTDGTEMVRRVAIYVMHQRWNVLRSLYPIFVGPALFAPGHLHELHNLLTDRFNSMTNEEKAATLKAMREISLPTWGDNPEKLLKRLQRRWLSAIAGKGYPPAELWLAELAADPTVGGLSEHPDFQSYIKSSWGPGPTPYQSQELVAFAADGSIVVRLNGFEQPGTWRGPTIEALVDAVEEAVQEAPESFLQLLPEFLKAKRPFQYGVISGLKHVWESPGDKQVKIDWGAGWEKLLTFFEQLIGKGEFWEEKIPRDRDSGPNRDWIASSIAEFLGAGAQNDEHAYPAALLPRGGSLIRILLQNCKATDRVSDDPMFQAMNSLKGKAVEALFIHTLRACRVSDKATGAHDAVWAEMKPMFEAELEKCKNANYEFSTLAGAYLANLGYMNPGWLEASINRIFFPDFPINFGCALAGLAYTPGNRIVYRLLATGGVLDHAFRSELKGRGVRQKLIQRVALAYLEGQEELDSQRWSYLFESDRVDDLAEASYFFWSVSGDNLSEEQKERVLKFWERCIEWSPAATGSPAKLLSSLSILACYLTRADDRERDLLMAVAPYVSVGYNADRFIEELVRLAEVSPNGVSAVLSKVLESHVPSFDYKDQLKVLLQRLIDKGLRNEVIGLAEQLRGLPGIQELFDRLTRPARI